jgi:very-short-patch-repair endonuclease
MNDGSLASRKHLLTDRAKTLRREATSAEKILWNALRGKQMAGLKFRRQQPVGNFIVDFFCASERLVIELDGASHEEKSEKDGARQRFLEEQGLRVLRFLNEDVEKNLDGVLETIHQMGNCGAPPQPLPRGEGLLERRSK